MLTVIITLKWLADCYGISRNNNTLTQIWYVWKFNFQMSAATSYTSQWELRRHPTSIIWSSTAMPTSAARLLWLTDVINIPVPGCSCICIPRWSNDVSSSTSLSTPSFSLLIHDKYDGQYKNIWFCKLQFRTLLSYTYSNAHSKLQVGITEKNFLSIVKQKGSADLLGTSATVGTRWGSTADILIWSPIIKVRRVRRGEGAASSWWHYKMSDKRIQYNFLWWCNLVSLYIELFLCLDFIISHM